jgi:hypothetical protein
MAGTCYRSRATPNTQRQSYFAESPLNADGSCAYKMKIQVDKKYLQQSTASTTQKLSIEIKDKK